MYWLSPGCEVRIRAYAVPEPKFVYSGFNFLDNWDAHIGSRSVEGGPGRVTDFYQAPYTLQTLPWASSISQPFYEIMQMSEPHLVSDGDGEILIDGIWDNSKMRTIAPKWVDRNGNPPSYSNIDEIVGWEDINHFLTTQGVSRKLDTRDLPKVKIFDEIVFGTGCVSRQQLSAPTYICCLRTELIYAPPDLVAYRSNPPQLFRAGFVAFASWKYNKTGGE